MAAGGPAGCAAGFGAGWGIENAWDASEDPGVPVYIQRRNSRPCFPARGRNVERSK